MPEFPCFTARIEQSLLMAIDIQPRLIQAMPKQAGDQLLKNSQILFTAASRLAVPIVITEQYPKGLGHTEPTLIDSLSSDPIIVEKTCFSAMRSDEVVQVLNKHLSRQQIILFGSEAHICVLQSAIDIHKSGYKVMVVEDAMTSRCEKNRQNAIARLTQSGIVLTNTESVLFEWLADANHPEFKTLSKLIL